MTMKRIQPPARLDGLPSVESPRASTETELVIATHGQQGELLALFKAGNGCRGGDTEAFRAGRPPALLSQLLISAPKTFSLFSLANSLVLALQVLLLLLLERRSCGL